MAINVPITADGDFDLIDDNNPHSRVTIYLYGSFGGGTVTIGYRDASGSIQPYTTGSAFTVAGEFFLECGLRRALVATMAGSTTPTVNVEISPCPTGRR